MKKILFLIPALFFHASFVHAQIITTVAGNGDLGYNGDDIPATSAELYAPIGIAIDAQGNLLIGDTYNNRIRKVDTGGIITTIAGNDTAGYNGDNIPATNAQLYRPAGIICDHAGNIYFADAYNNRIRKIDVSGIITTITGNGIGGYNGDNQIATISEIYDPHSIAIDVHGNMYITDWGNARIRKVSTTGIITTIAGTGTVGYTGDNAPATDAQINSPYGIVVDGSDNIYFADANANVVRKIDVFGIITTVAGGGSVLGDNGSATAAELFNPAGLAIDGSNNVYIADSHAQRVRKVASTGIITTTGGTGIMGYSGDNGPATAAQLSEPTGIAIGLAGELYVADFNSSHIRRIGWPLSVNMVQAGIKQVVSFPNPSHGAFTTNIITNTDEDARIIITNAIGKIIKVINARTNSAVVVQIDVPPGIYCLSAVTSQGTNSNIISIVR